MQKDREVLELLEHRMLYVLSASANPVFLEVFPSACHLALRAESNPVSFWAGCFSHVPGLLG